MPTRIMRDGILTSPRVNLLSEGAELFYRRLMSVVDDHGRFYATPMLLHAAVYPRRLDKITEGKIASHLAECQKALLLVRYTVKGEEYLQLEDFGQRVQAKSKFPNPPDSTVVHGEEPESPVNIRLGVVVVEGEVGGEGQRTFARWSESLNGIEAVPADHGVFAYAEKVGIPREFLALAWAWFEKTYGQGGRRASKKYKDWPGVFRDAVEGGWPKLWFFDNATGECRLNAAGLQLQRELA